MVRDFWYTLYTYSNSQARSHLGTPGGGEELSERGPNF